MSKWLDWTDFTPVAPGWCIVLDGDEQNAVPVIGWTKMENGDYFPAVAAPEGGYVIPAEQLFVDAQTMELRVCAVKPI